MASITDVLPPLETWTSFDDDYLIRNASPETVALKFEMYAFINDEHHENAAHLEPMQPTFDATKAVPEVLLTEQAPESASMEMCSPQNMAYVVIDLTIDGEDLQSSHFDSAPDSNGQTTAISTTTSPTTSAEESCVRKQTNAQGLDTENPARLSQKRPRRRPRRVVKKPNYRSENMWLKEISRRHVQMREQNARELICLEKKRARFLRQNDSEMAIIRERGIDLESDRLLLQKYGAEDEAITADLELRSD